ncbi:MAG: hypothetical protein U0791_01120 [Gemmataceae bacterium]
MAVPSGEITARPMVARACGCMCEFQHYAVDKYRAQRLAKFQKTRCAECVAKLNEAHKQAAAEIPKKGEAILMLPIGTQVNMNRKPDGNWTGTLVAEGTTVTAEGVGPQGLTVALARNWLAAKGIKASAKKA